MMIDEKYLLHELRNPATKKAAFTQLVKAYQETLYWQIRRMVLRHEDADDVLQETFIKAWNNIDSFREDAKLLTWLFRIAINESLNHLAKEKKMGLRNAGLEEMDATQMLASDPYFDGDEAEQQLQNAIQTLPEKQRLVFILKYFQEMKYEEMSQALDTSVGALKASYHFAIKKILQYFEQKD